MNLHSNTKSSGERQDIEGSAKKIAAVSRRWTKFCKTCKGSSTIVTLTSARDHYRINVVLLFTSSLSLGRNFLLKYARPFQVKAHVAHFSFSFILSPGYDPHLVLPRQLRRETVL